MLTIQLEGLDAMRASLDQMSQRVSLTILVSSLLLRDFSEGLFIGATLFGLWLIVSLPYQPSLSACL